MHAAPAEPGLRAWLRSRFDLARHGPGQHLPAMDGLRGVAVLLVFGVHFATQAEPWLADGAVFTELLAALRRVGHAGVDLFFVLSGLLIYGALIAGRWHYAGFMRRRLQRLYPTFLAVFLLYLLLSVLMPAQSKLPAAPADAALYLLANLLLLPGLFPIEPMISVAWSLSYELAFYLLMPVLVVALQLRRWSSGQRVLLFLGLALVTALNIATVQGHVRFVMFLAGVLLFEALQRRPPLATHALPALVAVVLALVIDGVRPVGSVGFALRTVAMAAAFWLLCHVALTQPAAPLARVLSWEPLRWLGAMSYSFYLIHSLALKAVFLLLAHAWPAQPMPVAWHLAAAAVSFGGSLLASAALFLAVERPLSLAPRPRPAAAAAPAAVEVAGR